jgi:carboxypeptidase Taq
MDPRQAYEELAERSREIFTIHTIAALTAWDQQVNMPPKGVAHRATMMAYLAQLEHEKQTNPHIGELLAAAATGQWGPDEAANLREWQRSYDQATKLPPDLVRRQAELVTHATQLWELAREQSDYAAFAPSLADLIAISREVADHLGWQAERYDALLDLYEPGLTTAQCETLFTSLRQSLVGLLQSITASPRQPHDGPLGTVIFPRDAQRAFGVEVSQALGFDYAAGRLDVSAHPFTEGIFPGDVRLTTRYDERWPLQALMGTIHEAGHGMYEQGLPLAHLGTPRGQAVSLGVHESQSRFWENNVGRSRPFWAYWFPRLRTRFPSQLDGVALDDFYRLANRVQPSLVRVEADEVTYNLHIMVRFEIERDLFRDALRPADLRDVWNSKYKAYLGLDVPDDRLGILQDVHWAWCNFGYFPTYTLGTVYAAQLEAALRRAIPDLDARMAAGEFAGLLSWLREQIHGCGMLYRADALIEHATGRRPSVEDYVAYLARKYGELYL